MSSEKDSKLKALQLTLDRLDKTYGKGTVMKMGDSVHEDIEFIPTGSIGLDYSLGIGGYPRGRVVEIYGPESSGKTTLTLHAIAECQKIGGIAAFIDAEHAFDRFYAQNLGVNIDELIISQPDHGEQALEIADNLIRSGAIDPSSVAQISTLNVNLIITQLVDYNSTAGITLTSNNISVIPFTPTLYGFDEIISPSNLVPVVYYIPTSATASVVSLPSAVNANSVNESTTTVTGTAVNVQ